MAKLFGINGYASGKLGNTVLAVYNGTQVARQFQPIVSNPKSPLQNQQRAKGNLTGRISSFVPKKAIIGLGSNGRQRRAYFLKNILKKATVTVIDGKYTAKIASEDVVFSKGALISPLRNITVSASAHTVNVNTSAPASGFSADEWSKFGARIVVMIYDGTTQELVECSSVLATMPTYPSGSITTVIHVGAMGGFDAEVYLIPMSTEDGSAMSVTTDMANLADDDIAALLAVNGNSVVFNYGNSVYIGRATYTPTSKNADVKKTTA